MAQKLIAFVFLFAVLSQVLSIPTKLDLKVRPRYDALTAGSTGKQQRITLQDAMNSAMKQVGPVKLDATGDANTYVDVLLEIVRLYMNELGLDDIALPDESVGFNTKFLLIPIYANVNLTNGFLKGADTIHRTGDCTVTVSGENVNIEVMLGFTDPSAGYDITTDVEGLLAHGSAAATIQDISVQLVMFVDTNNWSSYVNSFDILDIGFISVSITGLGLLDPIANLFADGIANLLKGIVGNILEGPIQQAIQDVLDKIFPGNAALGGGFISLTDTSITLQKSIEFMNHYIIHVIKMLKAIV